MINNYVIQIEQSPSKADIVFTSINNTGMLGQLTEYVLDNSGLVVDMPTSKALEKGFQIERVGNRILVFLVTVDSVRETDFLLQTNLDKALTVLGGELVEKNIWVPLMGTGAGRLAHEDSFEIIKSMFDEHNLQTINTINISLPSGISKTEIDGITRLSASNKIKSPLLPEKINDKVNDILAQFPLESLSKMTLQTYAGSDDKKGFIYWLEFGSADIGGIGGGSSFKFGIFKRKDKTRKSSGSRYSYNEEYGWLTRYGASPRIAFRQIRSYIARTAEYAALGNLEEIGKIPLDSRVKWKIAFLYQNFNFPIVLSLYKKQTLQYLSGINQNFSFPAAYRTLISQMPNNKDVWSYSNDLWHKWQLESDEKEVEFAFNTTSSKDFYETENEALSSLELNEEEQDIQQEDELQAISQAAEVAGYINDSLEGIDQLNIENKTKALASIIAHRETKPPLSIGIFGEWGMGKSFFMKNLESQISDLGKINFKTSNSPYLKHIVPIEFNAWNYVESNLWASMAQQVYQGLHDYQRKFNLENGNDTNHDYWLNVIRHGDAQAKILEREIEQKQLELNDKNDKLTQKLSELEDKISSSDITMFFSKVSEVLSDDLPSNIKESMAKTEDVSKNIESFTNVAKEIESLNGKKLCYSFQNFQLTSALLTASGVICLLYFIYTLFDIPNTKDFMASSAAMATILAAARGKLQSVMKLYSKIGKIKKELDEVKSKKVKDMSKFIDEADKLNEEVSGLYKQKIEAKIKVNDARERLGINSPDSLIEERVAQVINDQRYSQYLGLPALLNEDFQKLSNAIKKDAYAGEDSKHAPIHRIVLYIDDLDRCPSDVCIKVLEAIHLFMASEAFIVVVGVDPSVLFAAIRSHYSNLMSNNNSASLDEFDVSTPEEYLEKILQIPIWLHRPEGKKVKSLVTGFTDHIFDALAQNNDTELDEEFTQENTFEERSSKNIAQHQSNNAVTESKSKNLDSNKKNHRMVEVIAENSSEEELDLSEQALERAQHQKLETSELLYMNTMAPILGRSPRSIKRFINLYLFVKASLSEDKFEELYKPEHEAYRLVIFLLSIIVSWPRLSDTVVQEIIGASDNLTIDQIVNLLGNQLVSMSSDTLQQNVTEQFLSEKGKSVAAEKRFDNLVSKISLIDKVERARVLPTANGWAELVSIHSYHKLI